MAIATDFNPGSAPGASLLLAMNMACQLFGLTPTEALDGVTRNAARALGLQQSAGSLEPGRVADFAVWDIETLDELGYWLAPSPCAMTVRGGTLIFERRGASCTY